MSVEPKPSQWGWRTGKLHKTHHFPPASDDQKKRIRCFTSCPETIVVSKSGNVLKIIIRFDFICPRIMLMRCFKSIFGLLWTFQKWHSNHSSFWEILEVHRQNTARVRTAPCMTHLGVVCHWRVYPVKVDGKNTESWSAPFGGKGSMENWWKNVVVVVVLVVVVVVVVVVVDVFFCWCFLLLMLNFIILMMRTWMLNIVTPTLCPSNLVFFSYGSNWQPLRSCSQATSTTQLYVKLSCKRCPRHYRNSSWGRKMWPVFYFLGSQKIVSRLWYWGS